MMTESLLVKKKKVQAENEWWNISLKELASEEKATTSPISPSFCAPVESRLFLICQRGEAGYAGSLCLECEI